MSDFNIRCIWHMITKTRDEGFGTLMHFADFAIRESLRFLVSIVLCFSLLKLWVSIQNPFCIGMGPFDEKTV